MGARRSAPAPPFFFKTIRAARLPPAGRAAQLAAYQASCTRYPETLQALLQKYEAMENKACFYCKLSPLYYGIAVMQTTIAWCGLAGWV
ncbi:hypothetical protein [Allofournierella sp.]|uniref:hypothetical protein n=1 Tax=Allofournierella sp. TaxID=1940256 RepID=UPI003AB24037